MDDVNHFDQSTWLAKRVIDAAVLGPPQPPHHVVLPGARAAIAHDRLLAYHAAGLGEHQIRERINRAWNA